MKIALGTDHGGVELKEKIKVFLSDAGYIVVDVGCCDCDSVDYPEYGFSVAGKVASGVCDRGILLCKSGIGMSIVANKVKGIRAALCLDNKMALSSRKHNDANVLVIAALYTLSEDAISMISIWLKTDFDGERHQRRVNQIIKYEEENYK